jgi:hypothetical protein
MMDVATMENPTLKRGDRRRDQDPDHCQSPCGDLANSITPLEERDWDWDESDLRDIIHNRDARCRIENQC